MGGFGSKNKNKSKVEQQEATKPPAQATPAQAIPAQATPAPAHDVTSAEAPAPHLTTASAFDLKPHDTIPPPDGPVLVCILDGWGENENKDE